jgi:hypothetical protein
VQERPLAAELLAILKEDEETMGERIEAFLDELGRALNEMEVAFE